MKLNDLSIVDKEHWQLHLNAALKDNPLLENEIKGFLAGDKLPNLKHPSDIHDWLEQPDRRAEMEVYNG